MVLAKGIVMGGDDIDVGVVQRFGRNTSQRFAVNDEMILVELPDVGRDFARPGWSWQNLVPGFPAENRGIVAVFDAGVRVLSREKMADGRFEIVDDLRIGPKIVGLLTTERGVFTDAAPPLGLIDEGNDDANPFPT